MNTKKILSLLAALLISLGILASCGNGTDNHPNTSGVTDVPAATDVQSESAEEAPEIYTEMIYDGADVLDEAEEETLKTLSRDIEAEYGYKFAVYILPNTKDMSMTQKGDSIIKALNIEKGVLLMITTDDNNYYGTQKMPGGEIFPSEDFREILFGTMEDPFMEHKYGEAAINTVREYLAYLEKEADS